MRLQPTAFHVATFENPFNDEELGKKITELVGFGELISVTYFDEYEDTPLICTEIAFTKIVSKVRIIYRS